MRCGSREWFWYFVLSRWMAIQAILRLRKENRVEMAKVCNIVIAMISPLLANMLMRYVFDDWMRQVETGWKAGLTSNCLPGCY